jgi:hypothetical protein
MCELTLQIKDVNYKILAENTNAEFTNLVYDSNYNEGDQITLSVSKPCSYLVIQLDDVMNPFFVFMKKQHYTFAIPFGDNRDSYNPKVFSGNMHLLKARMASDAEIKCYKNLAQNGYDCHENDSCFPHVFANVETRSEAVFAARNAIDGNTENHFHGKWPYESWGINQNPDAEITLDFGRIVEVNKIVLFIRADFPHDSYWRQVHLRFSDGSSYSCKMKKSDRPHIFLLEKRQVIWVKLCNLNELPRDRGVSVLTGTLLLEK